MGIENYILYRRDRVGRRGGGVAIYARATLGAEVWVPQVDFKDLEILWVRYPIINPLVYICAIYHPPKPIYNVATLLDCIEAHTEEITAASPNALIVIAGDVNTLPDCDITDRSGLSLIVHSPTRGENKLDRIYVSNITAYDHVKIIKSVVKSDHKAIVANSGPMKPAYSKTAQKISFRPKTPALHAQFLENAPNYQIHFIETDPPQSQYDSFYEQLLYVFNSFYPEKTITMTSNDPPYVTPQIKKWLRDKNTLMRSGRVEEAEALAARIGKEIIRFNSAMFRKADENIDAAEMWGKVRQLACRSKSNAVTPDDVTAASLNEHYATISTDANYSVPLIKQTVNNQTIFVSEQQVFRMLDKLKPTASGLDKLPAWFLRVAAPIIALPVSYLFNLSISTSAIPQQWKQANIIPVSKVPLPKTASDFRPISLTPVLARVLERHIVQSFMYPSFNLPAPPLIFHDQYAFRPTGSTTAALIGLLHSVTNLLNANPYVIVYALDFSKAFDTVRHRTLAEKLATLSLPDQVYNWLLAFLEGRTHSTSYKGDKSSSAAINSSVVQGSAMGPAAYIVTAADLVPMNPGNSMKKYADDSYLIVPASNISTRISELNNIDRWALNNNLKLNRSKSLEIIFTNPTRRVIPELPHIIPGIERVDHVNILGVTVSNKFSMKHHIDKTLTSCTQTLFALRTLRAHGMNDKSIKAVFQSVAIAKILYAAPAWHGFMSTREQDRINSFLRKSARAGFCSPDSVCFLDYAEAADDRLYEQICQNHNHVLYSLLPPVAPKVYNLRNRGHGPRVILPSRTSKLVDSNFFMRMTYKNCY